MSKSVLIVMKEKKLAGNIYKLMGTTIVGGATTVEPDLNSTTLWHIWLGHMSKYEMMELHKRKLLKDIKTCKIEFYKYCVLGTK